MKKWLAAGLVLAASSSQAAEVPRLEGTVVSPGQRVALFAAGSGGTIPVGIGEMVGAYTVREIQPGQVELENADQRLTVSVEGAVALPSRRADPAGVTFGLVLHQQGPSDD